MKRRSFIQKGCVSLLGASTSLLSACAAKTTALVVDVSANNELLVSPSAFNHQQTVLLQHPSSKFPICLYKDSKGAYTASLMECTHQSCMTEVVGEQIICPCHGARYVLSGEVVKGPALKDLKTFKTRVENNTVYIELGET